MFRNRLFKNVLFKGMPHKEQDICEVRLVKVIKHLKIEDFNFNWDRNSCYIEFSYHHGKYRLEHSIDKAKERGILLRNGLDCLNELTQSLEDLSVIVDRGTYKFETWIAGMKQSSSAHEEYEEEFHIKYRSVGKQNQSDFHRSDELDPFHPETKQREYEEIHPIQMPVRK
ncbi:hypothetical protein ACQCVE_14495 [Metabacillus sp. 113a]|uniref:hypothetical protein n=1 Tax=Metabacillus sp. 113a TaxID=3404706 RepID=UPI003CF73B34